VTDLQGDAFAFDQRSRLVVVGGQFHTSLIDINNPEKELKQIKLENPKKWFVTNYDFETYTNSTENNRYLQTVHLLYDFLMYKPKFNHSSYLAR
jgi:hypothetical protein